MIGATQPTRPGIDVDNLTPYEGAKRMGRRLMRDDVLQRLTACMAGETDARTRDAIWRCIDQVQRIEL